MHRAMITSDHGPGTSVVVKRLAFFANDNVVVRRVRPHKIALVHERHVRVVLSCHQLAIGPECEAYSDV